MILKDNKKVIYYALLGLMAIIFLAPYSYADEEKERMRTLSLSATAVIKVEPDSVFINTGLTTLAKTAQAALSENSQKMGQIIEALKRSGLKTKYIQTTNFSVGPHYEQRRNNNHKPVITGFQVENAVRIEVKNIASLGEILDKVVNLGANRINSIAFNVTQTPKLKDEVAKKAIEKVKRKAQFYAENMGVKLGDILSISQSADGQNPRPNMRSFAMDGAQSMSVPIAAGEGTISSVVHVVWAIE